MYKVLYRKYRPQVFADVVGQPQVTVTLKNELKSNRVSHAYLFTGSRGTGKTTCAKILSKAVNCLNLQDGDPCGECEVCKGLDEGSVLDVVEIDAASNNGVDSIRTLIEESNFTPAKAKYRVYIIDEVHMLSVAAFNALLKTLEEPPAHVIFILATTEVHKLLPTILSRCQRFDFKRIAPEDIADRLEYVCKEENATIDREAAIKIARLADGALRDALSILDQCLGRDNHVTVEIVNETAGTSDRKYLSELASAVMNKDASSAFEIIDGLHKNSKDMSRLCEEMAEYFRALMIIKTTRKPEVILMLDEEEISTMTQQAIPAQLSTIIHALEVFENTLSRIRFGNQRTEMEMAFVKLCSPELDGSCDAIVRRLEALEKAAPRVVQSTAHVEKQEVAPEPTVNTQQELPASAEPEVQPAEQTESAPHTEKIEPEKAENVQESVDPEVKPVVETEPQNERVTDEDIGEDNSAEDIILPDEEPEPQVEGQIELGGMEKSGIRELSIEELSAVAVRVNEWPEIIEAMKTYSSSIAAAFTGSSAYASGGYMLIDAPQIAFELMKRASLRDKMREVIKQITGKTYKLGPYKKATESEEAVDPLEELTEKAEDAGIEITEL